MNDTDLSRAIAAIETQHAEIATILSALYDRVVALEKQVLPATKPAAHGAGATSKAG